MTRLEDLKKGVIVRGLLPNCSVQVIDVTWHGTVAVEVTYKDGEGNLGHELLYRGRENTLSVIEEGHPWSFDADGRLFRLASEAQRIRLAYLFDPLLAVHTSMIDPLPHQITAVYETILPKQPLHFLLADDPGSGKTIMAGLLIKELIARGDLKRCLVCCPGNLDEQWQDEMANRFHLDFRMVSRQATEQSRAGNPFLDWPLVIARLDWMSRNEDVMTKLSATEWDLVVVDEAHKMSATYFGGEVRETKRYRLGKLLGGVARNLLLLTATPHNGKEEDFQLFMALLDADRFEGKPRSEGSQSDLTDLMRRMIKEDLKKFDGSHLFPERRAYSIDYPLPPEEKALYNAVTGYVQEEFNRADKLQNGGRKGTVGFALTTLQRRLASSPAAIHESLKRRRERLEKRLKEEKSRGAGPTTPLPQDPEEPELSEDDLEDLDDAPSGEVEQVEEEVLDQATAARTISELEQELSTLRRLEAMAQSIRSSGADRKWEELSKILLDNPEMFDRDRNRRKVVIFTEHRDTLQYLHSRIQTLTGKPETVRFIDGSLSREQRRVTQHAFTQDKDVTILVATDAAGEGINLQRAHLMVNYDLPWNPNRIEQRFGRIHRIGQTEVCHLWNLVSSETREGEVYARLLDKLKDESKALGGRVFDVLGKLFREQRLRDLLIEAVRYGERSDVRQRLEKRVDDIASHQHLVDLIEERALATDAMDSSRIQRIREEMERAEALKLQPHFIRSFFTAAIEEFGGSLREREERRYEITHVPAIVRSRERPREAPSEVLARYERVVFDKELISVPGKPIAEFLGPGHPLLDTLIDLVIERHGSLLKRGAILVDPTDPGDLPRVLFYLEHSIQDARSDAQGNRRVVSKEVQFVETDSLGSTQNAGIAPYLDYRPISDKERSLVESAVQDLVRNKELEVKALQYAVTELVPRHFEAVIRHRKERIERTASAVKERLTTAIRYWDTRAMELKDAELRGKPNAKINSGKARQRADELEVRLKRRLEELEQEKELSPLPPVAIGGAVVIPIGFIDKLRNQQAGATPQAPGLFAHDRDVSERLAVDAVLAAERSLGRHPTDLSPQRLPWDIESRGRDGQHLLFIESKGRVEGSSTVTVGRREIITGLNKRDDYILAIVMIKDGIAQKPVYIRHPYTREPDFAATSVNYDLDELIRRGGPPS